LISNAGFSQLRAQKVDDADSQVEFNPIVPSLKANLMVNLICDQIG